MREIGYRIEATGMAKCSSKAIIGQGDAAAEAQDVLLQIVDSVALELLVTIGGIQMPLSFWQNPDHWAEEWQEHIGDEDIDAENFVLRVIAESTEDS